MSSPAPRAPRPAPSADVPPTGGAVPDPLLRVAGFARLLRDVGLSTTPGRVADGCAALLAVDLSQLDQVRDALRAVFVSRKEETDAFDAAFDLFWSAGSQPARAGMVPMRARALPLDPARAPAWASLLGLAAPAVARAAEAQPEQSSGYSPDELLRHRDFAQMSWAELQAVRRLIRQAPWRVAKRRTRRLRPERSGRVELRRTLRAAVGHGGEPLRLARAAARWRSRPIVILCDVSGSMDRYSRQLLVFAHAVGRRQHVETFAFSTHLTRITHLLRRGDPDRSLAEVAGQVHDIGGGTRIADSLHDFHRHYGRRVLGHGAVVLLISDGWDRGDPERLAAEMARLRRSCHRLIWLNPLLGSRDYRPETRGMRAALPHCDDFVAAHSVDALDRLGRLLQDLPARSSREWRPPAGVSRGDAGASRSAAPPPPAPPPPPPAAPAAG